MKLIREGVHPMKIVKYYSIFNDIIEKHLTEYQALKLELNNESSKSYITQVNISIILDINILDDKAGQDYIKF